MKDILFFKDIVPISALKILEKERGVESISKGLANGEAGHALSTQQIKPDLLLPGH